jgi:tRNA nucleotidyltransferase (CCA-adding enzyme)
MNRKQSEISCSAFIKKWLPIELITICETIDEHGGKPLAVGGCIRDLVMNHHFVEQVDVKDFDIEVFNMSAETLISILSLFGKVDTVGASFGVIKLTTPLHDFDFSLPRRDNKSGQGHKGFIVEVDPTMTIEEACSRRDFTMNSMAFDVVQGILHDPFQGRADILTGTLRPTSSAFTEDKIVRVFRGVQFAARFDMRIDPGSVDMCRFTQEEVDEVSQERIREEWVKWATKCVKPSAGIQFLIDTGNIDIAAPEFARLIGCTQDPEWHPEGDTAVHTMHVMDAMAAICKRDGIVGECKMIRIFGAMGHDFAKPHTWIIGEKDGRIHNPGHDDQGEEVARIFMRRIFKPVAQTVDGHIIDRVAAMVKFHMRHIGFKGNRGQVRRIALHIDMNELAAIVEADHSGRPFDGTLFMPEEMKHMLRVAEEVNVIDAQPKPIVGGQQLIDHMKMKPGKHFGPIIAAAFEAQMDDAFSTVNAGIAWVASWMEIAE